MQCTTPEPDTSATEACLAAALRRLRDDALALESEHAAGIAAAAPSARASARNLVHYLSLRRSDVRGLQSELLACGLSTLSNTEAHTLASLEATLMRLDPAEAASGRAPVDFRSGPLILADHACALLGPARERRQTRIMVTMPSEAASDVDLVRELLLAGMDVMRINCAHDDPEAWAAMARNLRRVQAQTGIACRIQADLAGPKLRTGSIERVGHVLHIKPRRDALGTVRAPARVPVIAARPAQAGASEGFGLSAEILAMARAGDRLRLQDLRGKRRELALVEDEGGRLSVETTRSVYLGSGTALELLREGEVIAIGSTGEMPEVVEPIRLAPGDVLLLTREQSPGRHARCDASGAVIEPARIHCTFAEVFSQASPGERVWIDDGRIGCVIERCEPGQIRLRVSHADPAGSKLRAGKGLNFPDTALCVPALGDKDRGDLAAVAPFADIVALSFLRRADDVLDLQETLAGLGARQRGVMLKIENREAFENLPEILLASLRCPPVGVMVARGDLAVELGFERLSEVQEEILWLCEAAHVPVIWATQMLESLAKKGQPSRAEVTDAAFSGRAECAMLNKGPNIVDTVRFLGDILERAATHRSKRRPALRRLAVSGRF